MNDLVIRVGTRNQVLILNEYKNDFAVISGYEGGDGKHYFNMVFPRDNKTKEPREVAIPQKVSLGPWAEAVVKVRQMLSHLEAGENGKPVPQPLPSGDDIPF